MNERTPLLVLGLGNVLLEDDGVGSAAVTRLRDRYDAPAGVRVFDGGTLGLSHLMPTMQNLSPSSTPGPATAHMSLSSGPHGLMVGSPAPAPAPFMLIPPSGYGGAVSGNIWAVGP